MTDIFPDDDLVEAVNELGSLEWTGLAYRHTRAGRDPLSGEGAAQNGGRWNPIGRPTIYLAQPVETCVGEFRRMTDATGVSPESLIRRGWELHRVEVASLPVLDVSQIDALQHTGLDLEDIADPDKTACQRVGEAAHFLGLAGIVAQSATGSGVVIAAFEDRIQRGQLSVLGTERLDGVVYERYAP